MTDFGRQRSTIKPEEMTIDDYSVWVASDITQVSELPILEQESGFEGYEYSLKQYSKDEYIQMLSDKNAALEEQVTDTQVALCEVYELLG